MHIHIIGIAGVMTASLAKDLITKGYKVTGSDQDNIYPPFSTLLKDLKIPLNTTIINKDIDLVIVGSSYKSFTKTQEEFQKVKKLNIPYISATKYLSENLVKKESILIAGTYAKTTITSLIAWIFINAKKNPSYFIGGEPLNKIDSLKTTDSQWSIIEADESINGLDTKAKFLYYPVKYLILTSTQWEHKDSYKNITDNLLAFQMLVKKVPKDGFILINNKNKDNNKILKTTSAKIIKYNNSNNKIVKISTNLNQTNLKIKIGKKYFDLKTNLIGKFNFENILAAFIFCYEMGIDPKIIKDSIGTFKGIKRRLELLAYKNSVYFFDDFSQSESRIQAALEALKFHYPKNKIKVFFEPHASFLQNKKSIEDFSKAFKNASEIVLGKIKFNKNIDKNNRVTANNFIKIIGAKIIYKPIYSEILKHYQKTLKPNDILIHMSSGGLEGIKVFKKIIKNYV